jgi:hypothetical protein
MCLKKILNNGHKMEYLLLIVVEKLDINNVEIFNINVYLLLINLKIINKSILLIVYHILIHIFYID